MSNALVTVVLTSKKSCRLLRKSSKCINLKSFSWQGSYGKSCLINRWEQVGATSLV